MGSPISFGDAISIIEKAIEIYGRIQAAPKQIEAVGTRMKRLKSYLGSLDQLIQVNSKYDLASKRPEQVEEIRSIVEDVRVDADQVKVLLDRWSHNIGPGGLELKYDWFAQGLFALGSSPKKLEELTASIDVHLSDIDRQILLLNLFAQEVQAQKKKKKHHKQKQDKSSPKKFDTPCGILIVDPTNTSRSKIAEGYLKLIREWTNTKGLQPFVNSFIHSAGIQVRNRSDCADIVSKSLFEKMRIGNESSDQTAMASLFDNKHFNYEFKAKIEANMLSTKSRGLTKSTFVTYDYILCFDRTDESVLRRIKDSFAQEYGQAAVSGSKGRIVMLGDFAGDGTTDISRPRLYGLSDEQKRSNWNKIMSTIKLAIRGWLKEELNWVPPPR